MPNPKILAFAGSAREASLNKKLIRIAVGGARSAGADVTLIDLRDFPMPLYDGDLEASSGIPQNAAKIQELLKNHTALLLACPEYNSSITPLLKNTIDWSSRKTPDGDDGLAAWRGKIAALMSASPSGFGGLRGLVHIRAILGNIGVVVLPGQVSISRAHEAFAPDGKLADADKQKSVEAIGAGLAHFIARLSS